MAVKCRDSLGPDGSSAPLESRRYDPAIEVLWRTLDGDHSQSKEAFGSMDRPTWKDQPDQNDDPAAASYVSLIVEPNATSFPFANAMGLDASFSGWPAGSAATGPVGVHMDLDGPIHRVAGRRCR
jgi:hypothetical protein